MKKLGRPHSEKPVLLPTSLPIVANERFEELCEREQRSRARMARVLIMEAMKGREEK